jgi:hypothetical protein
VHDIDPAGGRSSSSRPLSWQQARQAAWSADLEGPPTALVVRAVLITGALFLVAGLVGGWLWSEFADPPAFEVVRSTAIMGEEEAGRQFGVDVTFALIGLAVAFPLGLLTGWRWHRVGWPQAVACAVAAGIAAVVAWRLGVILGPEDPAGLLDGASVGDLLPEQLDVHARGLLLAWPVGALAGFVAAVLLFSRPPLPPPYGGPAPSDPGSPPGRKDPGLS